MLFRCAACMSKCNKFIPKGGRTLSPISFAPARTFSKKVLVRSSPGRNAGPSRGAEKTVNAKRIPETPAEDLDRILANLKELNDETPDEFGIGEYKKMVTQKKAKTTHYYLINNAPPYAVRSDILCLFPKEIVLEAHTNIFKDWNTLGAEKKWLIKVEGSKSTKRSKKTLPLQIGTRHVDCITIPVDGYQSSLAGHGMIRDLARSRTLVIRYLPPYFREDNLASKLFPGLCVDGVHFRRESDGESLVLVKFRSEDEAHKAQIDVHGLLLDSTAERPLWARIMY